MSMEGHLTSAVHAVVVSLGVAMSEDDPARRAIKVWMKDVMQAKDWSASEWAKRAGTSATNITRFLSPTSSIIPSSSTISKLARAAGTQPKLGTIADLNATRAWQIPYVAGRLLSGFSPRQLWEYTMGSAVPLNTIAVDGPIDGPAIVTDVPALGMAGRGVVPGDRILVEKCSARDLAPGNVVLFHHEGTPKIGEWQGSMVVFYPAVQDASFQPVRTSEVEVYGRVRRLIREL